MLQIGWPPRISDMLTHHRITTSSLCYKIFKKLKFPIFLTFPRHKMPTSSKQVVKRPSKRTRYIRNKFN